jgi:hypothetical protein
MPPNIFTARASFHSAAKFGSHGFDNLTVTRNDTEGRQRAAVDHLFPVDQNLVFGVASVDHVDVDAELTSELRRHTGGV